MLQIDRLLQINIALLVVTGALLLGLGHGNFTLPLMAMVAAIVSLVVTDRLGIFRLNRIAANLAAVLAAIYTLNDFLASNSEMQLLAIASLLIYLQMVLLFQKKTSRIYWQLLVLSLLQVVVAAALYVRVESGILFMIYMVLALIAMTLTYIHRETSAIREAGRSTQKELDRRSEAPVSLSHLDRFREAPLALFDTVHQDKRTVKKILTYTLLAGGVGVVFAMLFFYSIPRMHETWRGPDFSIGSQTGFAKTITFDETGRIGDSERVVFRANFVNANEEIIKLNEDPYFRAIVLNSYRRRQGVDSWQFEFYDLGSRRVANIPIRNPNSEFIRLRVAMDPNNESILFTAHPYARTSRTPEELKMWNQTGTLERIQQTGQIEFDTYAYEVCCEGIRNKAQAAFTPYRNHADGSTREMRVLMKQNLVAHPSGRQNSVERLANQLLDELGDNPSRIAIARKFNEHLRISGRYRYTFDFTDVPFDRSIDSVEDFISNHRSGHCEYFASALCMMLRHVGIPARIVIGFRCDDYNELSNRYVVQERHAHAWVEAYLGPNDVTPAMIDDGLASEGGAWMRLDPTPANPLADDDDFLTRAGDALDLAQMLWEDFVFGYNSNQQNSALYASLFGDSKLLSAVFGGEAWDNILEQTSDTFNLELAQARFLIQVSIVTVVIFGTVLYWIVLKFKRKRQGQTSTRPGLRKLLGVVATLISPKLGRWVSGPIQDRLVGQRVDFYERTTQLLSHVGFQRPPAQTHTEFIEQVIERIQDDSQNQGLAPILRSLLRFFYAVRFGNRALSDEQESEISSLLGTLEQQLKSLSVEAGTSRS